MKVGIALSGGGIRGIAHAGVLKALEENDIKVDIIMQWDILHNIFIYYLKDMVRKLLK